MVVVVVVVVVVVIKIGGEQAKIFPYSVAKG